MRKKGETAMKLSVGALAATSALLWGGAVLCMGIANAMWPSYGNAFLQMVASVYPGYTAGASAGQIAVGTGYALVDGGVGGAIFAALYNWFACGCGRCKPGEESGRKAA
jgi:hypothetical protein